MKPETSSRGRFWIALWLLELRAVDAGIGLEHEINVAPDSDGRFDVAQYCRLLNVVTFWNHCDIPNLDEGSLLPGSGGLGLH